MMTFSRRTFLGLAAASAAGCTTGGTRLSRPHPSPGGMRFVATAAPPGRARVRTFAERLAQERPFLIAHRGCTALAPENTRAAFVCAARLGLSAIETDVRLTQDGALVCSHDDSLKRMFGVPQKVSGLTLADLRRLTPASGNGRTAWPAEMLRIPTFAEYLDVCAAYDTVPFIETKGDAAVVKPVLADLRRRGLLSVAVLSAIPFAHIRAARRLDKTVFVHHIFSKPDLLDELAAMGNAGLSYNYPDLSAVPEGLVGRVHAKGVKMCLRAGDTPEAVARMMELGLDYIPTNVTVPGEGRASGGPRFVAAERRTT